jgi:hypothetical protein
VPPGRRNPFVLNKDGKIMGQPPPSPSPLKSRVKGICSQRWAYSSCSRLNSHPANRRQGRIGQGSVFQNAKRSSGRSIVSVW